MNNNGISSGVYNFGQIEQKPRADIASVYAATGQQLNKQYYENRQSYINNVVNPLSQFQARSSDRALLDNIKGDITSSLKPLEETNDWSQASRFVYDATENIIKNEGLKAIHNSFGREQEYLKTVKESGWDTQNQNAFILRSQLGSAPIQYDKEKNLVLGGGFNGVSIGKPMDVQGLYDKIAEIAAKAKASGSETKGVSRDSAYVKGFASMFQEDGETFFSHFMSSTHAQEGVSYDRIAAYARARLENSPEYINHLKAISYNNAFLARYKEDPTNPKGGYLEDFNPNHLKAIYKDSYMINSLIGLGIDMSDLGSVNKDGTFMLNKKMSKETKNKLEEINRNYNINIQDVITGGSSKTTPEAMQSLAKLLDKGFNESINNDLNRYLSSLNLPTDVDKKQYVEQWYQNVIDQNYIQGTINQQTHSVAALMSWNKTKTHSELVENTGYSKLLEAKRKRDMETGADKPLTMASMPDRVLNADVIKNEYANRSKKGEDLKLLDNELNNILIHSEFYKKMGLDYGDRKGLANLTETQIEGLTDLERSKVIHLKEIFNKQKSIKEELKFSDANLDGIYKEYQKNPNEYNGFFGVYSNQEKFILNNNIKNYDEYMSFVNKTRDDNNQWGVIERSYDQKYYDTRDNITKSKKVNIYSDRFPILSKKDFDKKIENLTTYIVEKNHTSNPNNPLKFSTKGDIIFNPGKSMREAIGNMDASIKTGTGDIILESSSGKGNMNIPLTDKKIIEVLSVNSLQESLTINEKGETIRTSNSPISKSEGINAEVLGIEGSVYSVDKNAVVDPHSQSSDGTNYLKVQYTLKGREGQTLGSAIVKKPISRAEYNQYLQENYNKAVKYSFGGDRIGDNVMEEARGKTVVQTTQSIFSFKPVDGQPGVTAYNTNDLTLKLANRPVGSSVIQQVNIDLPYNGAPMGSGYAKITKMSNGYKTVWGTFRNGTFIETPIEFATGGSENIRMNIPSLTSEAEATDNINNSFNEFSNQLLQLGNIQHNREIRQKSKY